MRSLAAPPASLLQLLLLLLLLGLMTAASTQPQIKAKQTADGVKLTCDSGVWEDARANGATLMLPYRDDSSGEYTCGSAPSSEDKAKIFVKIRTCDNCVELDAASVAGLVVGTLVATAVIAAAVRLVASPPAAPAAASERKKRSDRELLVRNEATDSDSNYQRLNIKGVQTYDELKPNSRR